MQQLIPVWVINLKKRPDRLQKIGNRLDQLGIKWQRIDAVDGLNCNLSSLDISAKEALNATTAANTIALLNGANILRVHDVKEAVEAINIVNLLNQAKN